MSAHVGTNADLLPRILSLYVEKGSTIADVTYGRGAFWRHVDTTMYDFRPSDLLTGTDCRHLPYEDASIDCLVIDLPYMHDAKSTGSHHMTRDHYQNNNGSHESVIRKYAGGFLEATRVLPKRGIIIAKCQDETVASKQRFTHMELTEMLVMFGFEVIDQFIVVQKKTPCMRWDYQKSARKNHSYFIVARFRT